MERLERVWQAVTAPEVDALRTILSHAVRASTLADLAADMEVYEYDLKNFLAGGPRPTADGNPAKQRRPGGTQRPKHRAGLRFLRYCANYPALHLSPEVQKSVEVAQNAMRRIARLDVDDDYFFKYFDSIKLMDIDKCRTVSENIMGRYYAYRLGQTSGVIVRSHLEVMSFNPYNKIPRFINRLKHGPHNDNSSRLRKSEGQILEVGNTYIFLSFTFDGDDKRSSYNYRGMKIIITPAENFNVSNAMTCGALFVSYSYQGRYEYGPMIIKKTGDVYDRSKVGEFSIDEIRSIDTDINIHDLQMDSATLLDAPPSTMIGACFSYIISRSH
jgi:hypothetical protein